MYRDGKDEIELCDLLLLLDDTAVLMEVKTADRAKRPNRTEQEWSDWANVRLKKALEQIERGAKALTAGLVKEVENDRQGRISVDPAKIKHIYGIAIVDHPTLDKFGRGPRLDAGGLTVSVLTSTHAEFTDVLTELSTPGDLIDYLEAREQYFAKHTMTGITELDLLAFYKVDPEAFSQQITEYDAVIIGEGCWQEYAKQAGRKLRAELDRPSYLVDAIIDRLHEARFATPPHIEEWRKRAGPSADPAAAYASIASQLARIRRIDRRVIGERLVEKSKRCLEQKRDRWFASSSKSDDRATIVFLVSTSDRETRMKSLSFVTMGAMLKTGARCVIGVAVEPVTAETGSSVDALMLTGDPEEYRRRIPAEMLEQLVGQFGEASVSNITEFGGLVAE